MIFTLEENQTLTVKSDDHATINIDIEGDAILLDGEVEILRTQELFLTMRFMVCGKVMTLAAIYSEAYSQYDGILREYKRDCKNEDEYRSMVMSGGR